MALDRTVRSSSARSRPGREEALIDLFLRKVARAPRRVLLLDYDGTLAPFRGGRELAMPYPGIVDPLRRLIAADTTRVGLVSGRSAQDLAARLRWLEPLPELWGSHGLERLKPDGGYSAPETPPGLNALLDDAESWAREMGWEALFERKPFGLALHRRPSPERFSAAKRQLHRLFTDASGRAGLVEVPFDGGIEMRPREGDKGLVVRTVLEEEGPAAAVAYLGDDSTDEDAFAQLRGRGLALLVRPRWRRSGADAWLRPPEDLHDFLLRWESAAAASRASAGSAT